MYTGKVYEWLMVCVVYTILKRCLKSIALLLGKRARKVYTHILSTYPSLTYIYDIISVLEWLMYKYTPTYLRFIISMLHPFSSASGDISPGGAWYPPNAYPNHVRISLSSSLCLSPDENGDGDRHRHRDGGRGGEREEKYVILSSTKGKISRRMRRQKLCFITFFESDSDTVPPSVGRVIEMDFNVDMYTCPITGRMYNDTVTFSDLFNLRGTCVLEYDLCDQKINVNSDELISKFLYKCK